MVKKLLFPLLLLLLLSGCGASAPMATAGPGSAVDANPAESASNGGTTSEAASVSDDEKNMPGETEAPGEASPAEGERGFGNYFIFVRENSTSTASDGTELLYEYKCDALFSSADAEQEQWVDSIIDAISREYEANSSNLLKYARENLEMNGKENFFGYSNYQDIAIGRHDEKIISLLVLSSIYSGGTHPNSVQTAWNLDMEQGKVLNLEDILFQGEEQRLAEIVQTKVDEKFQAFGLDTLFADYQQTIKSSFEPGRMTPYWYLNDTGLVIFYNQYTLGPYAAGIIKLEIPYESLEGILLEEYFPRTEKIPGKLLPRSAWEGYKQISLVIEPDGQQIRVGVEGKVFQLQVSEIFWLEGTAIGEQMLFSADQMDQMDVLVLIGGIDDEERSFALEYQDGIGNRVIYYAHPEGLSEEP